MKNIFIKRRKVLSWNKKRWHRKEVLHQVTKPLTWIRRNFREIKSDSRTTKKSKDRNSQEKSFSRKFCWIIGTKCFALLFMNFANIFFSWRVNCARKNIEPEIRKKGKHRKQKEKEKTHRRKGANSGLIRFKNSSLQEQISTLWVQKKYCY